LVEAVVTHDEQERVAEHAQRVQQPDDGLHQLVHRLQGADPVHEQGVLVRHRRRVQERQLPDPTRVPALRRVVLLVERRRPRHAGDVAEQRRVPRGGE